MKTSNCDDCLYFQWDEFLGPGQARGYRCMKGHRPRRYWHPDPYIVFEIKRKCSDFKAVYKEGEQ